MMKSASAIAAILGMLPTWAWAQSSSSILPLVTGAYAPAEAGCEAAAAAFIYIEDQGIGANKTSGKVLSVKQDGGSYVLDVLWIEAGADETDGDRDTVRIEVETERSFFFSNTASEKTLMRWCS